jgi:hypothetical protein
MAKTFEEYVRSGRLQKNFDAAVEKAAREAQQHGLPRPAKAPAGNDPSMDPARAEPVREKLRSR